MKIKTSELTGKQLDWAVQELEYKRMTVEGVHTKQWVLDIHTSGAATNPYSTNWLWAGPIIEREGISVIFHANQWRATNGDGVCEEAYSFTKLVRDETGWLRNAPNQADQDGPTPLIAAMRAYVASKLGPEVEIPERTES